MVNGPLDTASRNGFRQPNVQSVPTGVSRDSVLGDSCLENLDYFSALRNSMKSTAQMTVDPGVIVGCA